MILDPFAIEVMLREAVSGARSYMELSSNMKGFAERLRGNGVLVSLLDEDGESMVVYGGDGPGGAVSLYGYWGEFGAISDVVFNGRSLAGLAAEAPGGSERG
jgi:hypothetical protein